MRASNLVPIRRRRRFTVNSSRYVLYPYAPAVCRPNQYYHPLRLSAFVPIIMGAFRHDSKASCRANQYQFRTVKALSRANTSLPTATISSNTTARTSTASTPPASRRARRPTTAISPTLIVPQESPRTAEQQIIRELSRSTTATLKTTGCIPLS